ncbi:hypothetical protein IMCC26134_03425 [Verrucomicrobia bacterium IMCC26134]|nr:hypothetical protein IMCC26134_03425 [Verrucomicrobia bacterium IMCC26134]
MNPHYFLIEGQEVTGPHSMESLKQRADNGIITPATPARPSEPAHTIWMLIQEIPELRAELFKPNDNHDLRTKNPFKGRSDDPFRAHTAHPLKYTDSNLGRHPADTHPASLSDREAAHDPILIEQMLQTNAYHQGVAEEFDPKLMKTSPRTRRNRNFALIIILLNVPAFIAFLTKTAEIPALVIAPTVSIISSVLVYWVMYHLTDSFR